MKMPDRIQDAFFAPCGVNCTVCYAHLKAKGACGGCNLDLNQPKHCKQCKIKACALEKEVSFCFSCDSFPCRMIRDLDKSYRKRYGISLIENSRQAKQLGIEQFLEEERTKWTCPHCGGIISLQDSRCSDCLLVFDWSQDSF